MGQKSVRDGDSHSDINCIVYSELPFLPSFRHAFPLDILAVRDSIILHLKCDRSNVVPLATPAN